MGLTLLLAIWGGLALLLGIGMGLAMGRGINESNKTP